MNPREDDNITGMALFHKRYRLGDLGHGYQSADYQGWAQMAEAIRNKERPALMKPVYMYDHSGLTISTTPFGCPWDSGQIGFCWITREKAKAELGIRRMTIRNNLKLDRTLEAEIKQYDEFLGGNVYATSIVDPMGGVSDFVGGYAREDVKDEQSYAVKEAFMVIDATINKEPT